MKAKHTRHLIEEALRQILGVDNHLKNKSVMFAHEESSLEELEELERKATYFDYLKEKYFSESEMERFMMYCNKEAEDES